MIKHYKMPAISDAERAAAVNYLEGIAEGNAFCLPLERLHAIKATINAVALASLTAPAVEYRDISGARVNQAEADQLKQEGYTVVELYQSPPVPPSLTIHTSVTLPVPVPDAREYLQAIADRPAVDHMLHELVDDSTAENGLLVVREVINAINEMGPRPPEKHVYLVMPHHLLKGCYISNDKTDAERQAMTERDRGEFVSVFSAPVIKGVMGG